jgi:NAD(P)-dependent dehydrogenase (short-subunit alcohol dehydrogenase family)
MDRSGIISPSSVFVVSGGARGITAQCIIALAQRYRCKFILLGRSAPTTPETAWVTADAGETELKRQISARLAEQGTKPTPAAVQKIARSIQAEREIAATLHAVTQAGAQAEYVNVDITDVAALRSALAAAEQRMGTITGIVHGAGALADKLIEKKTLADFESVYAVKIKGLENLLACVPVQQLAYLVLFSSVAGFYGNIGQADYAIANEILNKTAHMLQRTAPACRVIALNWGPWDGGMVTPALKEYFAQHNIPVISLASGTQMLIHELERGDSTPQVIVGNAISVPPAQPDTTLRSHQIRRSLSLAANPFLQDHVIGGKPVLAAVFGVSWMTNTCEQMYPGYKFFGYDDYRVLKGIVFDETLADSYTLDLNEVEKGSEQILFDAMIWSETRDGKRRYHYKGNLMLRNQLPEAPIYTMFDKTENYVMEGDELYRSGVLFHGPSFQGVERTLNISPTRLTMQCRSPVISDEQQGQFPIQTFNPYLTDIQFQCMLIWVRHYRKAGGMPLGAKQIRHYRLIPPGELFYVSMDVQTDTESQLIARVTAHDEQGRVYVEVAGTEVTISERLNTLFAQSRLGMAQQRS